MMKFIISKKIRNFLLILLAFLLILFVRDTYSKYYSQLKVNVKSTSGNMIINARIDSSPTYVEDGVAYFKIIVTNYENNNITKVDEEFRLTIINQSGSPTSMGEFYYVDSNGETSSNNHEYQTYLNTKIYSFGKNAKEELTIKVYTRALNKKEKNINYHVTLDAWQKKMD